MADDDETNADNRSASGTGRTTVSGSTVRPEFLALKSGLVIRQYVIEEVIGAGGFGITYRARHERLKSKIFALKEYFPREYAARNGTRVVSAPGGDGTFRWGLERFLKEAEALAKCEHPSIVDVVDYFEENGTAYAVLGYIEGQQLGQWLSGLGREPTQAELDRVLMPLLDALEVVHEAKLLHLDIAPDNILIRPDGRPCLIDFGACREDIRGRSGKVSAIVKHGYSPPEQYHGLAELQGPWTDLYAVGATLYRAISGGPPMDSARRGALGDQLKPVAEMTSTAYRPGFMAAIDMALRLKPEERPRSVADWRDMLTASGPGPTTVEPTAAVAASPAQAAPRPARIPSEAEALPSRSTAPTRKPLLFGALALALLGGLGSLALWRSPVPAPSTALAPPRPQVVAQAPTPPTLPTRLTPKAAEIAQPTKAEIQSSPASAQPPIAPALSDQDRAREQSFSTCLNASEGTTIVACTRVAESDDTPERRARALHLRGVAERKLGNHDRAIADLSQSLALASAQASVLNDRGIAHFLKGDGVAAIRDYGEAIRADPNHAEALNNRAWAVFRAGRASEALPDADRATALAPSKAYVFDTRGHILEELGRRDDAIRDYERALVLDAGQEDSRAALARLRIRR